MSVLDCLPDVPSKRWLAAHLDHQDREFCLMWPFSLASNGYGQIGRDRHIPHRLMCEHRHGPAPTEKHQAAHSCGKGHEGCVNPWHLNWRTPAENQVERYEQSGPVSRTKLTDDQADEIRSLKGKEIITWTAKLFGVSEANIRQIQNGTTRKPGRTWSRPLTIEEVIAIRTTPYAERSLAGWAKELGVSAACVDRVRNRKTYNWVRETGAPGAQVPSQHRQPEDQR